MSKSFGGVVWAGVCALFLMASAAPSWAAPKIIFCTSAGINTAIQPVLYAQSAGLFEKNGVTVERLDLQDLMVRYAAAADAVDDMELEETERVFADIFWPDAVLESPFHGRI